MFSLMSSAVVIVLQIGLEFDQGHFENLVAYICCLANAIPMFLAVTPRLKYYNKIVLYVVCSISSSCEDGRDVARWPSSEPYVVMNVRVCRCVCEYEHERQHMYMRVCLLECYSTSIFH